MADRITIKGLEVTATIGVTDEERKRPQKLLVTVSFDISNVPAVAATDDLTQSTDYHQVSKAVKWVAAQAPRRLIETLAEDISSHLLKTFSIGVVRVEVRKFILPDAQWVGIKIQRKRKQQKVKKKRRFKTLPQQQESV